MGLFDRQATSPEMKKVMADIAQAEQDIQQRIFQLGQKCYEKIKDKPDTDPELYALADIINKLDQNRRSFYENKLRIEGKMMCANCGAEIPYGSVYCSMCGKRADVKEGGETSATGQAASGKKCAKCGTVLEEGTMFCTGCGTPVNQEEDGNVL